MTIKENQKSVIYQAENGAIELKTDINQETIWANRMQMAAIFGVKPQAISKHILKIYKENELSKKATSSKMELVQNESGRIIKRQVDYYNLEMLISVGYRISSIKGTKFRQWATKTLKEHITQGFTINKNILQKKENLYLQVLEDVKKLSQKNNLISKTQIIDLIQKFSSTWFSLESYDKQNFPQQGKNKSQINISFPELTKNLYQEVKILKETLITKKEATALFAQEKEQGNLEGILGNVLQSVFGKDAYETIEEKSAHLLYFIIKNHPFNDGNKRTGAFSFIWFLQKMEFDFIEKISPATLTTLTLLIAESNPQDKNKMIGLILLLLKK